MERAGLDLTTSAPKSVSLQALVFQDRRLEAAHQKATEQMLSCLEERYACTRLTQGGKRQTVLTGQLAIAQFHHDSSRSLDPQLHTHNLILNLQQQPDGQWRSLDNEAIYRAKMLLGKIYRNELALEVQNLGYRIQVTNDRHGLWELQGFTPQQLEQFSKRAQQIQAAAGEDASSRKKAWITLTSGRQDKQTVDRSQLVDRWQQEAAQAGLQPIQAIPTVPIVFQAEPLVNAALKRITKPTFRREELEHYCPAAPRTGQLGSDYHRDRPASPSNCQRRSARTPFVHPRRFQWFFRNCEPAPNRAPRRYWSHRQHLFPASPNRCRSVPRPNSAPSPSSIPQSSAAAWQDWQMPPSQSAIADQFEELARWIKPMPRAMILLRQRLEEQGKRVEALDVHLMTLLQEVEVKANPPTKDTISESQPTHRDSIAAPHADWDWERERS